ncbi:hypothetical protein Hanom_Chr11g01059611 [Helianthus anomalus]
MPESKRGRPLLALKLTVFFIQTMKLSIGVDHGPSPMPYPCCINKWHPLWGCAT